MTFGNMESTWRCTVCLRPKDLSGDHLQGKDRVRSDCWPCARKQNFIRVSSCQGPAAPTKTVSAPFLFSPPHHSYTSMTVSNHVAASPTTSHFLSCAASPSTSVMSNPFLTASSTIAGATEKTFSPTLRTSASVQGPPSSPGCGTSGTRASPVVMQPIHGKSPPFVFNSCSVGPPDKIDVGLSTADVANAGKGETSVCCDTIVWACSVCHKVKDLNGDHLHGKDIIHSVCWPCAKQRVFHRHSYHGSLESVHTASPFSKPSHLDLGRKEGASSDVQARSSVTVGANAFSRPSSSPFNTPMMRFPFVAGLGTIYRSMSPPSANRPAAPLTSLIVSHSPPEDEVHLLPANEGAPSCGFPHFSKQLLRCYHHRLVQGTPTWCVRHGSTLYVIAGEPTDAKLAASPADNESIHAAYEVMGRFAALLLSVENKLTVSPFCRMRRLFCPSEFVFAASCCYLASLGTEEGAASFQIFGPQVDSTKAPSLWGRIIQQSSFAKQCVVSEEQRVRAAQTLYRRTSWLSAPLNMTGAAIQLLKETTDPLADGDGIDVVLFSGTMKLEELPQAAAMGLPVMPT